ncbi:molecular chaperone [Parasphingorhabdus sp.]|uniref:fimbrial biogenesis chaperone n=1 Tax=Parasphingorhabdus sp. TaxID=2709688 RepID=UPI002F94EF58
MALYAGALGLLASAPAYASGLQVSPVTVTLTAKETADGLTLSNVGNSTVHAQVRVYHWRQGPDGDILDPSTGLVISPPMVVLEPGGEQLVRVIRTQPAPAEGQPEDSYRVVIDELPVARDDKEGIDFVLRYSLPIFIQPAGAEPEPSLTWSLSEVNGKIGIGVSNSGLKHAQIADVSIRWSDGRQTVLAPGLLGYALPGATRSWGTAEPWPANASAASLEVRINGQETQQELPLAGSSR